MNRLYRLTISACLCFSIVACSKGLDLKPDFTSLDAYKAKIEKDLNGISAAKQEAFNFAVGGVPFEDLRTRNKDNNYRQTAETELDRKADTAKAKLATVQKALNEASTDLQKIQVEVNNEEIFANFFGLQFKFNIKVTNGSSRDLSKLLWNASLYLDGSSTPVGKTSVWSFYESIGGLKAGQSASETIQVGNMEPPQEWVTLASQNAKQRKVVLELGNAYDFSNKSYLDENLKLVEVLQQIPIIIGNFKTALSAPDVQSTTSAPNAVSTTNQVNRTSCTNNCTNGSCLRTFPDGTQEGWEAPRKFDPISQNWEWDTTTNACGI